MAETDFISRRAIYDAVNDIGGCDATDEWAKGYDSAIDNAINIIESMPAADVAPVRHGHWIRPDVPNTRSYKWQCSECAQIAYWLHYGNRGNKNIICKYSYCPNCGAKMNMDGDKNGLF